MPSSSLLVQAFHLVFRLVALTTPTRGFLVCPKAHDVSIGLRARVAPPLELGLDPSSDGLHTPALAERRRMPSGPHIIARCGS